MGLLESKPLWADTNPSGKHSCDECPYKTDSQDFLEEHSKRYHHDNTNYILYMGCTGSINGRNELEHRVSARYIDMTGGQAAFHDGDLKEFGDDLVAASRETGHKLYHVYRMHDPGLGLDFPQWWVDTGVALEIFQQYQLPEDVKVGENDNTDEQDEEQDENDENDEDQVKQEDTIKQEDEAKQADEVKQEKDV